MRISPVFQTISVVSVIAAGLILALRLPSGNALALAQTPSDAAGQNTPVSRDKLRHAIALSEAFKEITRTVSPSVVNIRSTTHVQISRRDSQPNRRQQIPDDLWRRFFGGGEDEDGLNVPPIPDSPLLQPRPRVGEGSGVVIRQDGYIVTNNHVVDDADEVLVKLADDREFTASVLGTDRDTDLAVIHIEASGLPAAKFGNSDEVEPGEWVLAMGSPFGLEHTVTAGIVSAKGRQIGIIRDANGYSGYEDFIQTDAAINPGNSGGPLVNIYGQVVGINTAISTRTGVYEGVGFAIPSKMVQNVTNQIIEKGHVERGWLGVGIQPVTRDLAENLGLESTQGALVNRVTQGSPAEQAGVKTDDVIVKFNGAATPTPTDLMNMVAAAKPGSTATVEAIRSGKNLKFEIPLAQRNGETLARGGSPTMTEGSATSENLGLAVRTLTPEAAIQVGTGDIDGVLVTAVDPGSPAEHIGIQPGDVITKIGDSAIANVNDYNIAMKQQNAAKGIRLHVVTGGMPRVIVLKSSSK